MFFIYISIELCLYIFVLVHSNFQAIVLTLFIVCHNQPLSVSVYMHNFLSFFASWAD